MALIMLILLATLSLSLAEVTDLGLQGSNNFAARTSARWAAESGLGYCAYLLKSLEVPAGATGQAILDSMAAALGDELNGSAALQGESVGYDGSAIVIPAISLGDDKSFSAEVTVVSDRTLRLDVVGWVVGVAGRPLERHVSIEFVRPRLAYEYGMFSRGPITADFNFSYDGENDAAEASMCSAAGGVAIEIDSGYIGGDVAVYDPNATVDIGATVAGDFVQTHALPDVKIDGSVFEPFATNIVDANTDTSSGTFTNARIKAGTNPIFGTVTIQGVMYVEAPNCVQFTGSVDVIGVIVSEDPGDGASLSEHYISFKNNLSLLGVDELPETPEFAALRDMPGSAFLLPGFGLEFKNNFSSVNGSIVAERIIAKNNLDGVVYGSIICLGDQGLEFKNNSSVKIDRSKYSGAAPGVTPSVETQVLLVDSASYMEY